MSPRGSACRSVGRRWSSAKVIGVREHVYLVSKVLPSHASAEGTVKACEASLKRLGVEFLDPYLLHCRGCFVLSETIRWFQPPSTAGQD
ncbi:MAG: aldo/keto reductase [Janthinobacterium lividum]